MTKEEIEFAKLFTDCKSGAISGINTCYHPNCNEKSINSHILQKNGILSAIAPDKHLWELEINNFKKPRFQFKRTGINRIYSFNCFCNNHDTELFQKIETQEIDFNDYESCLLFALRTVYNEIWRKEVNLKMYECLIEKRPDKFKNPFFLQHIEQEKLGLTDLQFTESEIWNDLNNKTESFVFESRKITNIDICMSSFFNYDTTEEMNNYRMKFGKDMERVSELFINIFPYNNETILLMGYHKMDEDKVKGYFYTYFKESLKRVHRKLTNLMLFQCETWVVSDDLYNSKIKGIENLFADGVSFSVNNLNERQTFDLDIFIDNFKEKFKAWSKKYVG
ncbi:hypothetical protein [Nonlabens ulvanivorans]|uniref:hypothetical protein n=1 Tax=Nonlabens ulvanivorans TaxID=906888 RepID=UPI0005082F0E|nr:hypothetical protein [Nonlabens ulvanivorans]WOI23593.1 hypothetical protein R1T42_03870 [Nonlabens ulvanivorans]GAK91664.1 putative cytoplasmic protein [Nonlabens ulvanivorans]